MTVDIVSILLFSLARSYSRSFSLSISLSHSLAHSLIHSLTHSFIHSFIHSHSLSHAKQLKMGYFNVQQQFANSRYFSASFPFALAIRSNPRTIFDGYKRDTKLESKSRSRLELCHYYIILNNCYQYYYYYIYLYLLLLFSFFFFLFFFSNVIVKIDTRCGYAAILEIARGTG